MTGKVVSILNMKGGVGKTTISAHVMYYFYSSRRKGVLLVDLDPQFNLTQTLISRKNYEAYKSNSKTIYTVMEPPSDVGFLDIKTSDKPPPTAWDLAPRIKGGNESASFIDIVPGDFSLVKYSLISDSNKLKKVSQRFLQFISQAKDNYDLIVIDCNPSSSFITQCALQACSKILVPIKAETYSLLGLELLTTYINSMPMIHPKPQMSVLINAGPVNEHTTLTEAEIRGHAKFGPMVLGNLLPYSRLLMAKPGEIGFATTKGKPHSYALGYRMTAIVDELAKRWDL